MILKRALKVVLIATLVVIISETAFTNNSGRACYTGAPGEVACNNCHNTNALNSGGGSVNIKCPDMVNWVYTAGTVYNIEVVVKKAAVNKFGFGFESLLASGANAGIISTTGSTNAKILSGTVAGNSRTNAVHKQPANTGADSVVFNFQWTAPSAGTGPITFYASGNATNANNSSSGDFIYNTSRVIGEQLTTDVLFNQIRPGTILVFNNPFNNNIQVKLPELSSAGSLEFYNINGQLLESIAVADNQSSQTIDFSSNQINNGIYFIRLVTNDKSYFSKIILSK